MPKVNPAAKRGSEGESSEQAGAKKQTTDTTAPKGARNDTSQPMETGPTPAEAVSTTAGEFDVTTQETRSGAVGGTDSGGTGYVVNLPRCMGFTATQYFRYKKAFTFFTHAYSREQITIGSGTASRLYMSTGMAAIPTDLPFMFMSEQEFNDCLSRPETYVEHGKVSLWLHTCRTSYQANSTAATTVPVGNQIYINLAEGLESIGNNVVCTVTPVTATPAKVSSLTIASENDLNTMVDKMYGKASMSAGDYPPGVCGSWQEWDLYWALGLQHYEQTTVGGTATTNVPNSTSGYAYVGSQFREVLSVPNENTHIKTTKVDFGHRLLTNQNSIFFPAYIPTTTASQSNYSAYHGAGKWDGQGVGSVSVNGVTYTARPSTLNAGAKITATQNSGTAAQLYVRSLWDPRKRGLEPGNERMHESPPKWLAIGMAPVIGITAATNALTYQEGQCMWSIETELIVSFSPSAKRTRGATPYKEYTKNYFTYSNDELLSNVIRNTGYFVYGRPFQSS